MDKELIAMCDTPEIQDRWDLRVGSQYSYMGEPLVVISEHFDKTIEEHPSKRVYIPRIEDVLEWLGDRWYALVRQTDEEIYDTEEGDSGSRWIMGCFDKEGTSEDMGYANTAIKALLKAYMHLEHDKTWNGEAWV